MRWAGLFAVLASSFAVASVAPAGAAPRASNPAFLGIQMLPAPQGACLVRQVTADSPAEAAGLRGGDLITAIDGNNIPDCNVLLDAITAHAPGDIIQIRVARRAAMLTIKAQLTTRDVLLHKAIGKPMIKTSLVGVEDRAVYDLSALHGRMAIVGLFNPECVDCGALFGRFVAWSRAKARKEGGARPLVLAVYAGDASRDLAALQKSLEVPLAISEGERALDLPDGREPSFASAMFGSDLVLADRERLGVLVIDGRGIVQYVGPIAPNSDDTDAALDELFAVAEQAARRPS
ncbi:MAG TPA: PDZ domain-containing protein [Kofleriaceae bacterium]|nr:PDZ domain-containing protein [Kofleriaceae bacterium]